MPNQVNYGFFDLQSVFDLRVEDERVGVPAMNTAIDATLAEHNRQLDALLGLFVQPTDQFKVRFNSANAARLQPLDQWGRARPIQPSGYYETGFPLQDAGIAWGANFKARAKMRVEEVNRVMTTMIGADLRWMRDHVLAALFVGTSWTFPDPEHGDLVIKGLANGDTDTYNILTGTDMPGTDDHVLAQAAGIADATDPFVTIHDELVEHPENGGDVIAFIPTASVADTQNLASFHMAGDPNIRAGVNTAELVGNLDVAVPGNVIGYHDAGIWVVEWPILPAGYLIGTTTEGERPLAMRQEDEESLRGFVRVADREDYPYWESQYIRTAGFGGWNRVNGVVVRVGNGTYAVPTGYETPMP